MYNYMTLVIFWDGTNYYKKDISGKAYQYVYSHAKRYNTKVDNCCFVEYDTYIQVHIFEGQYKDVPLPTIIKAHYNI